MTDREALAAAWNRLNGTGSLQKHDLATVMDAAAKYLAQLPEKCGSCEGTGLVIDNETGLRTAFCPSCHGSGKVYPAELVERIAQALTDARPVSIAVAVLDALNGETL